MIQVPTLPGLYYQQVPKRAEPSPLRSDVAGFIGRTRRGPVGTTRRIAGFREFCYQFGGLDADKSLGYAMRAYFENGGQIAYIVRVLSDNPGYASGIWTIGYRDTNDNWNSQFPTAGRFRAAKYRIWATSPGTWADGLCVAIRYELNGPGGHPVVSMTVECDGEEREFLGQLVPGETQRGKTLEERVVAQSKLIRIEPIEAEDPLDRLTDASGEPLVDPNGKTRIREDGTRINLPAAPGPLSFARKVNLGFSDSPGAGPAQPTVASQYKNAIKLLGDQAEVAMMATPSLYEDVKRADTRMLVVSELIKEAEESQDRLVLIDAPALAETPEGSEPSSKLISFAGQLRQLNNSPTRQRAAAVYFPWLRVNDPLGGLRNPLRTIPPSGHVAGVISRVDRQRGAHQTPANVPVFDAVDVETQFDRGAGGSLNDAGVNLIRCIPGKGLMVWGGRTLDRSPGGKFLAHRRFIHRLIRAIRRVAEPSVFETNGPELWLVFVRAISTVLLEAFRSGALQGARPEEAFRVSCDEQINPLIDREQGKLQCEIQLALAAPMEFITIRVAVSRDGQVEVFDA